MRRRELLVASIAAAVSACTRREQSDRLIFVHQPLWGDLAPFRRLLDDFRRAHPEIPLETRIAPSASDALHQYLLTTLEAGAGIDVFVADVVWIAEFARAGWIADLSARFPPDRITREVLPGPAATAVLGGRTWAVPWWIDVGVLYVRTDLLEPPARIDDHVAAIERLRARDRSLAGHLFQGRQYEGLVCVAYEMIWAHRDAETPAALGGHAETPAALGGHAETPAALGGTLVGDPPRLALDDDATREAADFLGSLVRRGLSPSAVTTAGEEETRRAFQAGRAATMRNWPYAWAELRSEGSVVRDRITIAPLPTVSGAPGAGALGGWNLAIAAHVPPSKRAAAEALVAHLSSPEAQAILGRTYGRLPSLRASYDDPALVAEMPILGMLREHVARARPRPVTPYYPMISDILQAEFSAIVAGIRSPSSALERARRLTDRVMVG
jgi:multiple sugar transport system substrate-binding protein